MTTFLVRQTIGPVGQTIVFCGLPSRPAALQQQVVEGFARRMKPDGYLFLGHSENLYGNRSLLVSVGRTAYQLSGGIE